MDCPYHTPVVKECENIDGYVSKDSLYRMLSNFRTINTLTEREEDMILQIVMKIKDMPNEGEPRKKPCGITTEPKTR